MKKLFFLYVWLNLTRIAELRKEDLVKHIRKRTIQMGRLFFSSSLIEINHARTYQEYQFIPIHSRSATHFWDSIQRIYARCIRLPNRRTICCAIYVPLPHIGFSIPIFAFYQPYVYQLYGLRPSMHLPQSLLPRHRTSCLLPKTQWRTLLQSCPLQCRLYQPSPIKHDTNHPRKRRRHCSHSGANL